MRKVSDSQEFEVRCQFWFTILFDFMQHFRWCIVSEVGGLGTMKNYSDQALPSSHLLTMLNLLINACFMLRNSPIFSIQSKWRPLLQIYSVESRNGVQTPVRMVSLCKVASFRGWRVSVENFSKAFCLQISMA